MGARILASLLVLSVSACDTVVGMAGTEPELAVPTATAVSFFAAVPTGTAVPFSTAVPTGIGTIAPASSTAKIFRLF